MIYFVVYYDSTMKLLFLSYGNIKEHTATQWMILNMLSQNTSPEIRTVLSSFQRSLSVTPRFAELQETFCDTSN